MHGLAMELSATPGSVATPHAPRRRVRCGLVLLCLSLVLLCSPSSGATGFVGAQLQAASTFLHDHHRLRKVLLLSLFILVDTGQAFVSDWAERRVDGEAAKLSRRYVRQSLLVFEAGLAILFGLTMQWVSCGLPGVLQCFDWQKFLEFLPNCMCFSIGISLKMRALRYYNAGTIKVFGQLRMPMLAILSTFCLHRHYDFAKWQAIGILTVSCFAYMHLKEQGRQEKLSCSSELCLLLGWVVLNSSGGVLAEQAYKKGDLPFFAKFVSEDFSYFLIHTILLVVMAFYDPDENFCDRQRRPGGFFDAWDRRTLALALLLLADATVGNLLLQEFSALTKCITKAFCVAMVYFVSLTYSSDARSSGRSALPWLALLVIQASLMYSTL